MDGKRFQRVDGPTDWDSLSRNTNEEELVVVDSSVNPNRSPYSMKHMSNRDLIEKIEGLKRNLETMHFLDGGYKYRISIKHHEDELEKRRKDIIVVLDEDERREQVIQEDDKIYYPSRDDPDSVEIVYSDLKCLAPKGYVSSSIINFYIRYLQQRMSKQKIADRCYFFNTYFYEKLKKPLTMDNEASFTKLRRCWKGVNLFEKSYIFLPIHEQAHWSLVIICIPDKEGPILLHLDSLDRHPTKVIFGNIKRFLIREWNFLRKQESNINMDFSLRIDEKRSKVPHQTNAYDCGLFVLYYIQRFIETAPQRVKKDLPMLGRQWFKPSEASNLRDSIRNLLKQEFKDAKDNNDCFA